MSATSQVHRIKRQIYEIVVPDAGLASLCHTRLTALQSASIAPLIDRHCGELADGETLLRLDRVEVDLGTIPLAAFEPGVLERLHDRLKPALAAAIEARQSRAGGARQSRADSQLELLAAFARTGALPWWVDAGTAQPVAGALRRLATDAPDALRRLVRELATVPGAVERLLGTVDEPLLLALIDALAPRAAGHAPAFVRALPSLPTDGETSRPTVAGRRAAWRRLLVVVAESGEQWSAAADLPRAVLLRMAAEDGASYRELAQAWRRHTSPKDDTAPTPPASSPFNALDELLALLAELAEGTAPDNVPTPATAGRQLLQALGRGRVPAGILLQWLVAAAPNPASGWTAEVLRNLRDAVLAFQRSSAAQVPAPDTRRPVDLTFSEAEEVYVGNAGLVLLWPFLEGFFRRLGLLDERDFNTGPWLPASGSSSDGSGPEPTTAAQRAAGLLQTLASGDLQPAEHLLPLNKILCGLGVDDPFVFGPPVTEAELAEVEDMLTAAIRQAPILHEMSIAGFRGSFLLRPGQLSVRDPGWLLRVERASYDVVLERFPWPTQWVRLPWMNAPMQVDWV